MRHLIYLLSTICLTMLFVSQPVIAQTGDDGKVVEENDEDNEPADPADDIFLPSEDIKADSEISFPSDI